MRDKTTFFEKLKMGLCKPEDIDDYIDEWHDGKGGNDPIYKYLGMTWKEYCEWDGKKKNLMKYYGTMKKVASKQDNG